LPVKKVATKGPIAKMAKKSALIKRAAKKAAAKKTTPVPVQAATEVVTREPMPAELTPSMQGSSEVPTPDPVI
jgi:hypothetical protein